MVGGFGVIDDWSRTAEAGDNFLRGGQCEFFVVAQREFAAPGVEELNGGGSGGDLGSQVGNCCLGDAMQEFAKGGGFAKEETFYGGEAFFGAAFDHVAGESPGSGGKAQNGNRVPDFANDATNGFGEEAGLDFWVEEFQLFDLAFGANGIGEIGAGVAEFELEAHGFGGDEDVGEDDDGVDAELAKGLKRDFDGEIGRFADFEEGVICADGAVFGEITASLTHHPHGKARESFATAGAPE